MKKNLDLLNTAKKSDFSIESGISFMKFSATWCAPCKKMEPLLQKLEMEFDSIKFLSVDIDQFPDLVLKHNIKSVPTFLIFKEGQEVNRVVGVSLIEPLRKLLRSLVDI